MKNVLLSTRGLKKTYKGRTVVSDVNINVRGLKERFEAQRLVRDIMPDADRHGIFFKIIRDLLQPPCHRLCQNLLRFCQCQGIHDYHLQSFQKNGSQRLCVRTVFIRFYFLCIRRRLLLLFNNWNFRHLFIFRHGYIIISGNWFAIHR